MSKFRNKQTWGFDSKKEAKRFIELKRLEEQGVISDLKTQVRFELLPKQCGLDGNAKERAVHYIADFVYVRNGKRVVEDVKSPITRTPAYVIKRKLMLYMHGIEINEY